MFPLLCGTVQFNNSIMPLDRANTSPFYISIVTGPNTPLPEKKKKKSPLNSLEGIWRHK